MDSQMVDRHECRMLVRALGCQCSQDFDACWGFMLPHAYTQPHPGLIFQREHEFGTSLFSCEKNYITSMRRLTCNATICYTYIG